MGSWNPGSYSNIKIDELTQSVAGELDPEKRTTMMVKALALAKDDAAMIPLHQQPIAWGIRDGVKLEITADNKPRLWYAIIE